ncbi:MAG: OPT/YSL family transporter, partial [Candidatus Poseidoniaceae archaeon]|nr:OPT/YSL family transporter [Candidatus Poseidoniaceae archaeon]
IEKGTLTWLDDDMYNNLNTGVLEQYLEEKNLQESFEVSHWSTPKVFYGIAIGAVFSGVTAYIGLKLGLAISAAWYIAYLLGMALKWSPSEVNIATSATTGATHASTGFIFTFPAIFLLASDPRYFLADGPLISNADTFNLAFVGIVASMFAGFLGIMYFIIFRRVWLVEDPLPLPGFEATLKMLDIASDVNTGAVEHARASLKTIGWWTTITMGALFLVEYPLVWMNGKKWALLDFLAEKGHIGEYGLATFYSKGKIHQPSGIDEVTGESLNYTQWSQETAWNPFAYTYIGVALTPSMFAIGWFMKTRVAFLVNLGTLVGWFFLVPAVVYFNFPIYDATLQASVPIQDYAEGGSASLQMIAFSKSVRTIAIGSIVGGGMFGLAKMWKTFVNIFADIGSAFKGEGSQEYMEGKGWYEWPLKHIPVFMGITFLAMIVIFTIGGFSVLASLVFATVLILTTFLLGAIAVRVMGETGIEPVSGTSFIVLLMLLGVFLNAQDLLQLNTQDAVLLGLVGTTVFGSAISMSGTVIGDYKNSLYIGNRPYHISKGNIMGVIPGAIIGAGVAIFLSKQLADGTIDLMAPQANAFATFSVIFAEREGDLVLLALGFLLGMFVEWGTGMGTSFGLGMYLDVPHTLPMLIGGYSRDQWEERRLKPKIDAIKETEGAPAAEKQRALILLSTFMVAAGLLTGEAFFGTESSILSFLDTLVSDPDSTSWYIGRLVGFVSLNVLIGGGIYYLFKRAGVIGGDSVDAVLEN